MDYFRAILHADEKSLRAFDLTKVVIELNAANYTAWYFRRLCLWHLEANLDEELAFCNDISLQHQKNYQVWYHRQQVIEKLGHKTQERDLNHCGKMLEMDSKNYHVWSYRQWAVEFYQCWEAELEYTEHMITKDVRNNSAWNHRFFVLQHLKRLDKQAIDWAMERVKRTPSNESPWLFIRGILKQQEEEWEALLPLEQLEQAADKWIMCCPIRALLVDYYGRANNKEKAITLCKDLAESTDTIHAKYWKYRQEKLRCSSP